MATIFNNAQVKLSTTSTTDVYQMSTGSNYVSVVLSCLVANVDGTASADITMLKTDSANTEQSRIAHTIPVPADSSLELIPNKLVLKSGEKLRAIASSANDLDITVSVMEIRP